MTEHLEGTLVDITGKAVPQDGPVDTGDLRWYSLGKTWGRPFRHRIKTLEAENRGLLLQLGIVHEKLAPLFQG